MNIDPVIGRFEAYLAVFEGLFAPVTDAEASWKPDPGRWSLLEIVNHLADEENLDFRTRVDMTLHRPGEPWPGIDPQGWVTEKNYAARDFRESVERFRTERRASLAFLRSLRDPAWENTNQHRILGTMTAREMLEGWLAHDLLHVRQIVRLECDRLEAAASSRKGLEYAGAW